MEWSTSQRVIVRPSSETADGRLLMFALNSSCMMQWTVMKHPLSPSWMRTMFRGTSALPFWAISPSLFFRDSSASLSQNKVFGSFLACMLSWLNYGERRGSKRRSAVGRNVCEGSFFVWIQVNRWAKFDYSKTESVWIFVWHICYVMLCTQSQHPHISSFLCSHPIGL